MLGATDRPTQTANAQDAADGPASSDSATSASTNSPEGTSSQAQPGEPSTDGAEGEDGPEESRTTSDGSREAGQGAQGGADGRDASGAGSQPGAAQEPPATSQVAVSGGFADFANRVAAAEDWPNDICGALLGLYKTPEWEASTSEMKNMARRIAFVRLQELVAVGYRYDFLLDPTLQAWRAYIEYEVDMDALLGNRRAVTTMVGAGWSKASTAAKIALDKAFDQRMDYLKAQAAEKAASALA